MRTAKKSPTLEELADFYHARITESGQRYSYTRKDGRQIGTHRAILENRLGCELDASIVVHHVDGDGMNNVPSNLRPMSRAAHARHHHLGAKRKPSTCRAISLNRGNFHLTQADVQEIHRLHGAGKSLRSIGRKYGTSHTRIRSILNGLVYTID